MISYGRTVVGTDRQREDFPMPAITMTCRADHGSILRRQPWHHRLHARKPCSKISHQSRLRSWVSAHGDCEGSECRSAAAAPETEPNCQTQEKTLQDLPGCLQARPNPKPFRPRDSIQWRHPDWSEAELMQACLAGAARSSSRPTPDDFSRLFVNARS